MTPLARSSRRPPALIALFAICFVGKSAWSQDVSSLAGSSWPPSSVVTVPGQVAESSASIGTGDELNLVVRGKAATEVGSHRAYVYANPRFSSVTMGAASVFSDLLTIEGLSSLSSPGVGPASVGLPPIPLLKVDISGVVINNQPSTSAPRSSFEFRYLALLSETELPLEVFAAYLAGVTPKPEDTLTVVDATWDEESFAHGLGANAFQATLEGALAYAIDETTVRYGGWAYSGFFVLAGDYYELDFFNTVRVSVELPSGATLSAASGFEYVTAPVPEPGPIALLFVGLAMLGFLRHPRLARTTGGEVA